MALLLLMQLLGLLLLLVLSGFFSSSETACISLDPLQVKRIEGEHPGAARRIHRTHRPRTQGGQGAKVIAFRFATILVSVTLVVVTL